MFSLVVGLAAAFILSTIIFICLFLRLAIGLRKAVYVSWCDIVIIFHHYQLKGNIAQTDTRINDNLVKSTSRIFIPHMLAITIASAEKMKPEKIVIEEKVPPEFSSGPILYFKKNIIYLDE
jgi:hypothetical protein